VEVKSTKKADEDEKSLDLPTSRELIERFEAAYNAIDRFLRHKLGRDNQVPFSALLEIYWLFACDFRCRGVASRPAQPLRRPDLPENAHDPLQLPACGKHVSAPEDE
jgi:hypothetical protein